MTGIIYKYTNLINNKSYIGQTTHEKERKAQHQRLTGGFAFQKAIQKYGWDSFDYSILFRVELDNENLLREILNEKEIYYIEHYNTFGKNGYNLTKGGSGVNIGEFSKDHKDKISKALKGVKKSIETRQKLSEAKKEYYRQNPDARRGKTIPEDVRKKISETLKNKHFHLSEEHRDVLRKSNCKAILAFKDGMFFKEYDSMLSASMDLGICKSSICSCCRGLYKQAGGYVFKYKHKRN